MASDAICTAASEVVASLGGTPWGIWVQTIVFIAGAVGTFIAIRKNSKDSRRRATIDIVMHQEADKELVAAKKAVNELAKTDRGLVQFHKADHPKEYQLILDVLNSYEFVAAGIYEQAFDEATYKRSFCTMLIRDWDAVSGVVYELRHQRNKDTLFQDFECLAARWKKNPLKKKNPR